MFNVPNSRLHRISLSKTIENFWAAIFKYLESIKHSRLQNLIWSSYYDVWCKHVNIQSTIRMETHFRDRHIKDPCKYLRRRELCNKSSRLKTVKSFWKASHLWCLRGSWLRLCIQSMFRNTAKSSSAAGRTRHCLGNTSTVPYYASCSWWRLCCTGIKTRKNLEFLNVVNITSYCC